MSRKETYFSTNREAALALLNKGGRLTRGAGQFLGGLVAEPNLELSEKQANWIDGLLKKANLPPIDRDCDQ